MDQRVSVITLVVDDIARSRRPYVDGLGWRAELLVEREVDAALLP